MNYLLTFLGFALFILLGMIKTKRKYPTKVFCAGRYLKDELLTLLASAICAISFTLMLPDIGHVITPEYAEYGRVLAFVGGYLNYSIINGVVNTIVPKKFIEQ